MRLKGIFKDKSELSKFGILLSLIFVSFIIHVIIGSGVIYLFSENGLELVKQPNLDDQLSINYLKLIQIFSAIGLFITPTLFYAFLTNFKFRFLKISRQDGLLIVAIMMMITPFIKLILEWNMMISLPEWLVQFNSNSSVHHRYHYCFFPF